ncbi:RDD family protein [Kitasatospora sp. NPDC085895]|uniref:RDD family protein n=1 Tax=Kitasatospora sp. NPDC085895 TaxID=3155057 RepID=UPI00344C4C92
MSDLVTGEAVVLGLRAAKVPSRALAIALDLAVETVALMVTGTVVLAALPALDEAAAAAVVLGLSVFFLLGLPVLVETLSRGRSLGKLALGLRVVRTDGGPVRFRHALVRGLVSVLEIQMSVGTVAVIASLVSPQGRRLGDVFAGTLVVRERLPQAARAQSALPAAPPALLHAIGEQLVALDFSAVPDGLWLAVRQFLGRLGQLDPAVAAGMAERLAADLAGRTGRPVPYGVHPAAYLSAVLTERQRREWERAAEAARRQQSPAPGGPAPAAPPAPGPYTPQVPHTAPAPQAPHAPSLPPQQTPVPPQAPPAPSTGFAPPS